MHLSLINRTRLLSSLSRFTLCSPRGNWCHQSRFMKLFNRAKTRAITPKVLQLEEMTSETFSRRMRSKCPKRTGNHWLAVLSTEPTKEAALRNLWPLKVHQRLLRRNWKLPTTKESKWLISMSDQSCKVSLKSEPRRKWAACTRKEILTVQFPSMVAPLLINSFLCLKGFMVN